MNNTLIIVLILVAVLVGGYLFMNRTTDMSNDSTEMMVEDADNEITDEDTTMEDSVVEEEETDMTETVTMNPDPTNAEKQSGTATFVENDEGVMVTVDVTGYETDEAQPAHIHLGECPDVGDVAYPLENLVNGVSTTVLPGMTLDQLRDEFPLALNVHKSAEEVSVYTSCGDLEF